MNIISFEEGMKRKMEQKDCQKSPQENFLQAAENLRQNDTEENFSALFDSMFDRLHAIMSSPEIEGVIEREKEAQKRFYERYKDIFSIIPFSEIERVQYFSSAMLKLVPAIFHGDWQTRFNAYTDFGHFHLDEFEPLCGKLEDKYGKPEYPFQFKSMDSASLEIALTDCLTKIIDLCSQQSKDSNIMEILYQGLRLFELDELLTDLFGEELKAREKNDIHS